MDVGDVSSRNSRNKGYGGRKLCACRLPENVFHNLDRQEFRPKEEGNKHCSYCEWLDEGEVNGWPKKALLEARDETHEKKKQISERIVTVNFLRMELEQPKVGKPGCSNGDEENKRLGRFLF
ncbi:hypothetical protein F2Q68_00002289 [Brassica cretica]|uniref:Uncharacterized protein n=1 Tax=Brassica cretica TaxID=69181 RepID=A0A8S9JCN8_BRACR|nr:hypothetical protein F2Q68_00002289 [Brassica cretica]